jgi:hypothetical protein
MDWYAASDCGVSALLARPNARVLYRLVSPQGVNSTRQALRHANGWIALISCRLA